MFPPPQTLESFIYRLKPGNTNKGKENCAVSHEKANRTALQTSLLAHTHVLLVQTHSMPTVKEIAEQCRQL